MRRALVWAVLREVHLCDRARCTCTPPRNFRHLTCVILVQASEGMHTISPSRGGTSA